MTAYATFARAAAALPARCRDARCCCYGHCYVVIATPHAATPALITDITLRRCRFRYYAYDDTLSAMLSAPAALSPLFYVDCFAAAADTLTPIRRAMRLRYH